MDAIYNENLLQFTIPDSGNWTPTSSTLTDQTGNMKVEPTGSDNKIVRSFGGFDILHENLTFHMKVNVVNTGVLPLHEITLNIPGVGTRIFSIPDLSPGEQRIVHLNHSFDVTLTGTSVDVELSQTYISGGANSYIEIDTIAIKQIIIEDKTRSYFFLSDLFKQFGSAKTGRLNISKLYVGGISQLTPQYEADQLALGGSFPLDEWGFANCDFESNVCGVGQTHSGYNPFFDETLIDFNDVPDGEKRGRAINSRQNKDYGTGLFNIGVDRQSIFDANKDRRDGAFFVDIDYSKDFFMEINVFLSNRSNAYVTSYFTKKFIISWNAQTCEKKYTVTDVQMVPEVVTNIEHLGFLKGTLTPSEVPILEDICGKPKDTCVYKERTIGFATFVQLPEEAPADKGFKECCIENFVLAHLTDSDDYKNDYSGFWHKKQLPGETVVYNISGTGGFDEDITDDSFGTYITNHPTQPGLVTFVVDWRKILIANGAGHYTITKEVNIAGIITVVPLGGYVLKHFTNVSADKTVRIDSKMGGLLVELGVDFTGVDFKSSTRVRGFFGRRDPNYVEDNLINANYRKDQVSIRQENEYKFQTQNIPSCLTEEILDFLLMGNEVFMNDYNLNNHSYKFKKLSVTVSGNEGTQYSNQGRLAVLNLTFSKRNVNRIKRNY